MYTELEYDMNESSRRLLIVSNRLPVELTEENGIWKVKSSPGGLVTALTPLMRRSKSVWIGWPGCPENVPAKELIDNLPDKEFNMMPVNLSLDQVSRYYRGYANKTIWPLFHDLLGHFSFDTGNWEAYKDVNRIFAKTIMESKSDDSFVWIHDYQLLLVGKYMRELGFKEYLRYFLHIPFPSPDLLRRLPHYREVLSAMLKYDHIGFQTEQDKNNFIQCVKAYLPNIIRTNYRKQTIVRHENKEITLGNYPISIDFDEFNDGAKSGEVEKAAWYLSENINADKLMLGLDRLDYTKGIPERFLAFEKFLEKYPDAHGKLSLLQIVIPSRLNVPDYRDLKNELDTLAGRINGRFSEHGWIPIHYTFRSLDRTQLLGHYKACDIALITPIRDGMNLVSKEYCASSIDNRGVLILSEFAGSARQLGKAALLVNPYDAETTADIIYEAYTMPVEEQERRMKILRSEVKRRNVQRWINWFINEEELEEHTGVISAQ
jgi:trehalose 6-phosphate synthase/phosphatase